MAGRGTGRPQGRPRGSGRPRKVSNSTVESVDLAAIKYAKETAIMRRWDWVNAPDEQTPVFALKEAVIYRKAKDGTLSLANLCNVDVDGPFIVRGRLEVEDDDKKCLCNPSIKSAYIQIESSRSYSIGYGRETEDASEEVVDEAVLWASGEAGWYEINPSEEYQQVYDQVCEGVTLYYKVMKVYETQLANKVKPQKVYDMPLERVLLKYAVSIGDGTVYEEALQRCEAHALFLIAHFPKEVEFKWKRTLFYKWMQREHSDIVQRLEGAASAQAPAATPATVVDLTDDGVDRTRRSKSQASKLDDEDVEMADVPPASSTLSRTELAYLSKVGSHSHSEHSRSASNSLPATTAVKDFGSPVARHGASSPEVQFLVELLEEIAREVGDITRVKDNTVHSKMFYKCTTRSYDAPKEVTHFYAKDLLDALDPKWHRSPFYFKWLKIVSTQPFQGNILTPEQVPSQCVRRRNTPRTSTAFERSGSTQAQSSRTPEVNGSESPPRRGKTVGRRPSGKNAGLRLAGSSKRRHVIEDNDEEEDAIQNHTKSAKTSHHFSTDDAEDDSSDEEEKEDATSDVATPSEEVEQDEPQTPANDPIRVVVRAEKVPTMSPSGLNGTWKCEEEGCGYIVRSADEPEGKTLIAAHFRQHEARVQKINLALAEGTRGHNPINHLLEKIRSMGEKAKKNKQTDLDGQPLPQPIKRGLLI